MTPEVGDLLSDLVDKFQCNVFECMNCHTKIEYATKENYVPAFPCQICDKVHWRVYSINNTKIYR